MFFGYALKLQFLDSAKGTQAQPALVLIGCAWECEHLHGTCKEAHVLEHAKAAFWAVSCATQHSVGSTSKA